MKKESKKVFYKKWWFWLVLILIILFIHPYIVNFFINSYNIKVNYSCNTDSDCIGKYIGKVQYVFENTCFNKDSRVPIGKYNPTDIFHSSIKTNEVTANSCTCEYNRCVSNID